MDAERPERAPSAAWLSRRTLLGTAAGFAAGATAAVAVAARQADGQDGPWLDVRGFGAAGDGVADDTGAVQAAIDAVEATGGGLVVFPPGTFRCNVLVGSRVGLLGSGTRATTLKAVAGSNRSVVEGRGFASLAGSAKQTPETRGDNYVTLDSLTIDGDRASNAAGSGIRIWGRSHLFQNLVVQSCAEDGIVLEFTTHDGGEIEDDLEAFFDNVKTIKNGGNGWTHRGPHDSILSNFVTFSNDGWGFASSSAAGSFNGGISGRGWNSWLNGRGSFDFGTTLGFLSDSQATGQFTGVGIQLAAGSGSSRLTGILISAHETGLVLRGTNHLFSGVVIGCHNEEDSGGAGIVLDGAGLCLIDAVGSENHTAVEIRSEGAPNVLRGRFNVPGGRTLLAGDPDVDSSVDLVGIGSDGTASYVQLPGGRVVDRARRS
jgi:hypothetical protein